MTVLIAVTLVGTGLAAGAFFVFSAFIIPALDGVDPATATAAMQAMNREAVTPAFMTLLFGTALLCVALVVVALVRGTPGRGWLIAGAALYLVAAVGVTGAGNVPLNDALASVDAARATGARWAEFSDPWTALNHVRTVASVLAAAALAVGLTAQG